MVVPCTPSGQGGIDKAGQEAARESILTIPVVVVATLDRENAEARLMPVSRGSGRWA